MSKQPYGNDHDSAELKQFFALMKQQTPLYSEFAEDITGLPWGEGRDAMGINFAEFHESIRADPTMIRRFAFRRDRQMLDIVARPNEILGYSWIWKLKLVLSLGIVALAIWVSGWFLLCLLLVPIIAGNSRRMFDVIITRAAGRSERAFCALFYSGLISVLVGGRNFFWEDSRGTAAFEDYRFSDPSGPAKTQNN